MSKLYDLLSAMCGKIKKPDWNQNDETAPDYVKNRPFYMDGYVEKELLPEQTYSGDGARLSGGDRPVPGKTYSVMFDGAEYDCICVNCDGFPTIGNVSLWGFEDDTGEPFLLQYAGGALFATSSDSLATHTISISYVGENIKTIDHKFLPKDIIVNIVGEQDILGETYFLFDKTDEEINNALSNGSTVKLNLYGRFVQYDSSLEMFWGVFPYTTGTNGIPELFVACVQRDISGWPYRATYITASINPKT